MLSTHNVPAIQAPDRRLRPPADHRRRRQKARRLERHQLRITRPHADAEKRACCFLRGHHSTS